MRVLPARLPAGLSVASAAAAAAVLLVAIPGAGAQTTASAAAGTTHSVRTVRTTVRPVTADGHAASGYTVHRQGRNVSVDCSEGFPSPGAVSSDIQECSPSAAYAIACWKSATPHRTLCMRNPRSRDLYSIRLSGRFRHAAMANRKSRAPLLLVLSDGTLCSIRDGGAWGSLKSRPRWYGSYSCSRHGVVWSPPHAAHWGVVESHRSWTVRTAPFNGRRLVTRHVRRAFFVGTATS
jgi:hypothetical protein